MYYMDDEDYFEPGELREKRVKGRRKTIWQR